MEARNAVDSTPSPLQCYLEDPKGSLEMSDIRIGRFRIGKLVVTSREAAIPAQ